MSSNLYLVLRDCLRKFRLEIKHRDHTIFGYFLFSTDITVLNLTYSTEERLGSSGDSNPHKPQGTKPARSRIPRASRGRELWAGVSSEEGRQACCCEDSQEHWEPQTDSGLWKRGGHAEVGGVLPSWGSLIVAIAPSTNGIYVQSESKSKRRDVPVWERLSCCVIKRFLSFSLLPLSTNVLFISVCNLIRKMCSYTFYVSIFFHLSRSASFSDERSLESLFRFMLFRSLVSFLWTCGYG